MELRYCHICKEVKEFEVVFIILNNHKNLRYCLRCKTVVFLGTREKENVKKEKKGFFKKMAEMAVCFLKISA